MSETNVVTGFVSVEDGVKHDPNDQYSLSRKVRIEVGFTGDAADLDSFLDSAGNKANSKLAELLGTAAPVKVAEAAPRTGKPRVPKGAGATPSQSAVTDPAAVEDPSSTETKTPAGDPSQIDDGSNAAGPAPAPETAPSGQSPAADPAALDDWETQPEPITDAELNAAVQKRNGELGDPTIIRKLIATFNPDPTKVFQLREIAAAQRADFLAKLAALVKA